ncbi:hypothetical protein, unknown function [Leishmania donovani]|uniref:Uncharacterized protein n=1 Tax=Leishmania donovani TaxID=5661 RepID=E9BIF6_LEIDO|nr:hypothetical protein, unknown function [Leishmania donovani]CBZ35032.1 hypothetical protein, unknown function [Leishmania donovani]
MTATTTDSASYGSHPRCRVHTVAMSQAFFYVVIGVLVCLTVSCSASGYNASMYVNSDIAVTALFTGPKLVMLVRTSPRDFSPNAFTSSLYSLFSKADASIMNVSSVFLVNWCAKDLAMVNATLSCPEGAKHNSNEHGYVLAQVQLSGWNYSSLTNPAEVNLSSLGVTDSILVSHFGGTYNPDNTSGMNNNSYVINFASDAMVTYAIFGFLMVIVILALIGVAVCVCLCDSRQLNHNKSIVDRAIRAVHLNYMAALYGRSHQQQQQHQQQAMANFSDHLNLYADMSNNGSSGAPHDSQYWTDSPQANRGSSKAKRNGWEYLHREDGDTREMQEMRSMQP